MDRDYWAFNFAIEKSAGKNPTRWLSVAHKHRRGWGESFCWCYCNERRANQHWPFCRDWQVHKLQRVRVRDSQRSDKLPKEIYSWVINKYRPEPRQMNNGALKKLWKYWVQFKNLCLIDGIFYQKHQTELNFGNIYQIIVPWERVSNVLELLQHTGHVRIRKTYQRACKKVFIGRAWERTYGIGQKAVMSA